MDIDCRSGANRETKLIQVRGGSVRMAAVEEVRNGWISIHFKGKTNRSCWDWM